MFTLDPEASISAAAVSASAIESGSQGNFSNTQNMHEVHLYKLV